MKQLVTTFVLLISVASIGLGQKQPVLDQMTQVSQLPAEVPERITGLAFDGAKLWFSVYLSKGRYATFDVKSEQWRYSDDEAHHRALSQLGQPFSTVSGIAFAEGKLWAGGSYGESLGSIDVDTWVVDKNFSGKLRTDLHNSQSFSSLAFDGKNLWAAWHMTEYERPVSESQQLLKIDRETGQIIERYALPAGSRPDAVHGLTFDGEKLWHIKGQKLTAIDLQGRTTAQFWLKDLSRPSGLAWDGQFLWIVEFSGKLWRIPLK